MDDVIQPNGYPDSGHRERLRQRFREHGLENFQDYEALELMLLCVTRQKEMKPVAKRLIKRSGSFQAVIDASPEDLLEVEGVGENAVTLIHFVKQAAARYLAQSSRLKVTPEDIRAIIDYCRLRMGALPDEQFRIFGLNAGFVVVGEDVIAEGTIDQSIVYPRKVIETAIKRGATTLIFVHNHPGGGLFTFRNGQDHHP